ncbi:uncharacterized protein [Ptychodera flava]|uniref:uncharacterized protein n=1 Tax=Ptychodera flava TaxID=63121 RepID=UPI003969FB64
MLSHGLFQFKTSMECIAAVSCEWCNKDIYEDKPFCYDLIYSCKPAKDAETSSPGVITGVVIAVVLVVVIVIVIIVALLIKLRNISRSVPRDDNIPVAYRTNTFSPAPSAPSAPSFNPAAPFGSAHRMQPEPTYQNPYEFKRDSLDPGLGDINPRD